MLSVPLMVTQYFYQPSPAYLHRLPQDRSTPLRIPVFRYHSNLDFRGVFRILNDFVVWSKNVVFLSSRAGSIVMLVMARTMCIYSGGNNVKSYSDNHLRR